MYSKMYYSLQELQEPVKNISYTHTGDTAPHPPVNTT